MAHRGNIRIVYIIYKVIVRFFETEKKRVWPRLGFESRKLKLKGADAKKTAKFDILAGTNKTVSINLWIKHIEFC